jgi:hypothetical protein
LLFLDSLNTIFVLPAFCSSQLQPAIAGQKHDHAQDGHCKCRHHRITDNCVANARLVWAEEFDERTGEASKDQPAAEKRTRLQLFLVAAGKPPQKEHDQNIQDHLVGKGGMKKCGGGQIRELRQAVLGIDRNAPRQLCGRTVQFLIDVICRARQGLPEQGGRRDRIQEEPVIIPIILQEEVECNHTKQQPAKEVQTTLPNIQNLDGVIQIVRAATKNAVDHIP